jgi:predicted enzyme involved in methoxymalonyl-ACP biosynthesis
MSPYLITGLASGLLGIAIGAGTGYKLTASHYSAALATEKAAHASDLERVNAEAAQQLATALSKQQAAEGRVATVEQQFNTEVSKHAKDNLAYQSQLASGAQRLRVRVTSCVPSATAGKGTAAASGNDGTAAVADLDPTVATGVVQVAADDQHEIDKLKALQAYVAALQEQGFIAAPSK